MKLKGKRALITGGSRGIGKSIVLELAANGCDIVFTYNSSADAAKLTADEAGKTGSKIYSFKADASSYEQSEKVINFTLENLGGLDILVNNAGITRDGLLLRLSEKDFDDVINANLKSVFNYTKYALKSMIAQKDGRIINISSVVALVGNPGQTNYVASKAGVIGFTKSSAKELASRNIKVNAIAPGFISTDMTSKLNEKQKEAILSMVPLKKIGSPEDIAKAVLFLSSEDSDYITGQVLVVDGGMTM